MIYLDKATEDYLEEYGIGLKVRKDKVMVTDEEGKATIPSKLYPLTNKRTIQFYCYVNTEQIEEGIESFQTIKDAYDSVKFEVGKCYQNTENLYRSLVQAGIPEDDMKTYVGWILVGSKPIHHCWLVYKGKHVLDGSITAAEMHAQQKIVDEHITDINKQREIVVGLTLEALKLPNSQIRTFGKVMPIYDYVGTVCEPDEGRAEYRKLISAYPNHPSYAGAGSNPTGASKAQQMILDRM
ncbi:hypothetical protein FT641_19525 [Bacillus paranthracis]|uniref:hypothetical protein n=1 Tax=Bacillus paranthracis TaxID=2026186 RepID=UPI00187A4B4F|nr:hypothetical protein [Bacillus paranthracis]MBE7114243.1 hypothetical protein [Bacillus paranthracis]MBE7154884.1 hypothetical protein [Bacillus paranthracis]